MSHPFSGVDQRSDTFEDNQNSHTTFGPPNPHDQTNEGRGNFRGRSRGFERRGQQGFQGQRGQGFQGQRGQGFQGQRGGRAPGWRGTGRQRNFEGPGFEGRGQNFMQGQTFQPGFENTSRVGQFDGFGFQNGPGFQGQPSGQGFQAIGFQPPMGPGMGGFGGPQIGQIGQIPGGSGSSFDNQGRHGFHGGTFNGPNRHDGPLQNNVGAFEGQPNMDTNLLNFTGPPNVFQTQVLKALLAFAATSQTSPALAHQQAQLLQPQIQGQMSGWGPNVLPDPNTNFIGQTNQTHYLQNPKGNDLTLLKSVLDAISPDRKPEDGEIDAYFDASKVNANVSSKMTLETTDSTDIPINFEAFDEPDENENDIRAQHRIRGLSHVAIPPEPALRSNFRPCPSLESLNDHQLSLQPIFIMAVETIVSVGLHHIPVELAACVFNISKGELASFHKFIDPGNVPQCHFASALQKKATHGIPYVKFELTERHYKALWKDLILFFDYDPDKALAERRPQPLIYGKGSTMINHCIDWLATKSGEENIFGRAQPIETLLEHIHTRTYRPTTSGTLQNFFIPKVRGEVKLHKCKYHVKLESDAHEEGKNFNCALANIRFLSHLCTTFIAREMQRKYLLDRSKKEQTQSNKGQV